MEKTNAMNGKLQRNDKTASNKYQSQEISFQNLEKFQITRLNLHKDEWNYFLVKEKYKTFAISTAYSNKRF